MLMFRDAAGERPATTKDRWCNPCFCLLVEVFRPNLLICLLVKRLLLIAGAGQQVQTGAQNYL